MSSSAGGGSNSTVPSAWNLKSMLAKRLLRELIERSQGASAGSAGVVLVVDPHTSKILSSCLRMHDLLAAGVLVLQHLHLQRERLQLPAVYFVEPTHEAFEMIADDFPKPPAPPPAAEPHAAGALSGALQSLHLTSGDKDKAAAAAAAAHAAALAKAPKCQYNCAHLFFTRAVSPKRMSWLQKSSNMDMRKIKSFVELGADFLAFESRVFLLDRPHTIPILYPIRNEEEEDEEETFSPEDDNGRGRSGRAESPPPSGPTNSELLPFVTQLQSVCATMLAPGERPYVRYISADAASAADDDEGRNTVSQQFAELFDRELTKAAKAASSSSSSSAAAAAASPPPRTNTTVLIVDRSLDPLTPLMHEFTFQAMLNDLLKVHGEIVHLTPPPTSSSSSSTADDKADPAAGEVKSASSASRDEEVASGELVLSEEDALWVSYRHRHIGTVMSGVNKKLKEFTASNKMAQYQLMQSKGGASKNDKKNEKDAASKDSVKDVLKAVASMPEYKLAMKRYSKHVSLAEECLSKFKQRHLALVGELEQSLASNSTPEGHVYPPGSRELREALKALVLDRAEGLERPLGVVDKLRLVVIYALVQGGLPPALKKVLAASLHPELMDAVLGMSSHLRSMDVSLDSFTVQLSRARIAELIERGMNEPLALMRYVPVLHGIMDALLRGELPEEQFPYTSMGGSPSHTIAAGVPVPTTTMMGRGGKSADDKFRNEEERRKAKLLADAEADVAHRATGRSARRKAGDKDAASVAAMAAASASAAASSDKSPAISRHPSLGEVDDPSSNASTPHRYIVFMLGGLAFSEMRSAYEVAAAHGLATAGVRDAPLLIGSTAALTPSEFLLDISGLSRKEFFDRVLASAAVGAAHSIGQAGEEESKPVHVHAARSAKPVSEEEKAEQEAANAIANSLKSSNKKKRQDDEEDSVDDAEAPSSSGTDMSDDDSDDDAHASRNVKRTAGSTTKPLVGGSSNGAGGNGKAGATSAAAKSKLSVPKRTKELVFESESDGEEGEDRITPPLSSKSTKPSSVNGSAANSRRTSAQSSPAPSPSMSLAKKLQARDAAAAAAAVAPIAAAAAGKGKKKRVILDD